MCLSCNKYDDAELRNELKLHEERLLSLERQCTLINKNLESISAIVNALQEGDYIKEVTPIYDESSVIIGYSILFNKSGRIYIYNGKDGTDGENGKDGKDGAAPILGIQQDTDGIYYWTINGVWLQDTDGNKLRVTGKDGKDGENGKDGDNGKDGTDGIDGKNGKDGKDGENGKDGTDGKDGSNGITPTLKIEDNKWYVSYDSGATWAQLGNAIKDNPPLILSIEEYENYVEIILNDGNQTVLRLPKYPDGIDGMFPDADYLHKLISLKKTASDNYSTLSLLCSTDVHGMVTPMSYYLDFYRKYSDYIDEMINVGDLLGNQYGAETNELPYDNLQDFNKVLCVIGNHDVFNYNNEATEAGKEYGNSNFWAPNYAKYDRLFKNIAQWNVISPLGVNDPESKYYKVCYYYKDYQSSSIRLIILDSMDLSSEQLSWFSDVVEDAKDKGLQVLCVSHIPMGRDTGLSPFDCNWVGDHLNPYGQRDDNYLNIIDNFMENGGSFICWLHGHYHYEEVGVYTAHPKQIYIILPCTMTRDVHQDVVRIANDASINNFNVVSIEPYSKLIRMMKVGCKYDRNLKHRETLVLDYGSESRHVVSEY